MSVRFSRRIRIVGLSYNQGNGIQRRTSVRFSWSVHLLGFSLKIDHDENSNRLLDGLSDYFVAELIQGRLHMLIVQGEIARGIEGFIIGLVPVSEVDNLAPSSV